MASIHPRALAILPTWLQTTALAGLLAGTVELPAAAPTLPMASQLAPEALASSRLQHERALMTEVRWPILESR